MEVKSVLLIDNLEDEPTEQYGLLLNDRSIICLCCGGYFEDPEDYTILETYFSFPDISNLIKQEQMTN